MYHKLQVDDILLQAKRGKQYAYDFLNYLSERKWLSAKEITSKRLEAYLRRLAQQTSESNLGTTQLAVLRKIVKAAHMEAQKEGEAVGGSCYEEIL